MFVVVLLSVYFLFICFFYRCTLFLLEYLKEEMKVLLFNLKTRFPYFFSLIHRFTSKSLISMIRLKSKRTPREYFFCLFLSQGVLCRICKGNHITAYCPNRGQEEPVSSISLYTPKEPSSPQTYRPPIIRDRISCMNLCFNNKFQSQRKKNNSPYELTTWLTMYPKEIFLPC